MPEYIFISNLIRGQYISKTADGEDIVYDGISLYLGQEQGDTPEIAWGKCLDKAHLEEKIPEIKIRKVYAYEITGKDHELNFAIGKQEAPKEVKTEKYQLKTCEWCGDELPSNGAAQFAHLMKHIRE
jgi:hypothetical protein